MLHNFVFKCEVPSDLHTVLIRMMAYVGFRAMKYAFVNGYCKVTSLTNVNH